MRLDWLSGSENGFQMRRTILCPTILIPAAVKRRCPRVQEIFIDALAEEMLPYGIIKSRLEFRLCGMEVVKKLLSFLNRSALMLQFSTPRRM